MDIVINIAPIDFCPAERKSIIMVRSILVNSHESQYCYLDGQDLPHSLKVIGEHNSLLRRQAPVCSQTECGDATVGLYCFPDVLSVV